MIALSLRIGHVVEHKVNIFVSTTICLTSIFPTILVDIDVASERANMQASDRRV